MRRLWACLLALSAASLLLAAPAPAAVGLQNFDVTFTNADGTSATQAGSHPYAINVNFDVNTALGPHGEPITDEAIKDLNIAQIPGFVGNPTAVPTCSTLDFLTREQIDGSIPNCANASAVGVVRVEIGEAQGIGFTRAPVYLLEPPPGVAAKLGFWVKGVPVTVDLGVNESFPYNVVAALRNVSQTLEVFGSQFTIWGDPASAAHDEERGACYEGGASCPAGVPNQPFLTLPRACTGPLETKYELDSWQNPGDPVKGFAKTHDETGNPQGMTGCGRLGFSPRVSAQPTSSSAESASGLDVEINVDDEGLTNPSGIAQSDIKDLTLAFPPGVTANPSAAEGLGVCTKVQYESESLERVSGRGCPEESKLGSVEVETPILEGRVVRGSVYLAQQDDPATTEPGAENPFDSLLALYMVVREPQLGIFVKQPIRVETDELTGQLVSTAEEIPQFPLSRIALHLRSGPRSPLITPPLCGTYTSEALLTPWAGGQPLATTSSFTVDSGVGGGPCPPAGTPPFAPGFEAGSINNAAGAFSPFTLRLTRQDGEQDITRFSSVLPRGVLGRLAGVAQCPDAAIEAAKLKSGRQEQAEPSCPSSALIGHTLAGAGVGSALTYVPGSLYLAGPYHGDPLSVVAIVPAVAGPFDVGTVVVREALTLNPITAEVEVDGSASDPIPHILKGIPLKLRDLRVFVDRPSFTLNPTSCDEEQARATLWGSGQDPFSSADDVAVPRSSRYQAASCASLFFKPNLKLTLKGGTKRGSHPSLNSVLTPRPGDANIASATVLLPHSEFIDPERISQVCTRVQFAAAQCPPSSVLGTARAYTPLLDEPLEGPVYFRANGGEREIPDIVADLHGIVNIVLVGFVDSVNERIRTRFLSVPDAPVSKFTLTLKGGKEGVIVNSANLCKHKRRVKLTLTGQNGRRYVTQPALKATSCKAKKARGSRLR